MAEIHPTLKKDCQLVGHFDLCHLLLMNDASYPWLILIPDRDDMTEIYQLSEQDQVQLLRESSCISRMLNTIFSADKINIAALGNVVSQLHIHHIARYRDDLAWPKPIWGYAMAVPYDAESLRETVDKLRGELLGQLGFSV